MRTLFGYLDGLYTNELNFWRAWRVPIEEAEPFEVPDDLPCKVYRVDGEAQIYLDLDDAVERFRGGGDQLLSWHLKPGGHHYELIVTLDREYEISMSAG